LDIFAATVSDLTTNNVLISTAWRSAILLLMIFVSFSAVGQAEYLDTWQDESKPDSTRLQAIDDFSWALINTENMRDSGIALAHKELEFAKQRQNSKFIILAQMSLGIAHFMNGEYDKALQFYEQCKERAQIAGDENSVLKVRNNLASVYRQQGDHQNALKQYKSGLLSAENLKNRELIAVFSSNMGLVYNDMGLLTDAIIYHSKALSAYEQLNDLKGVAKSSGNLAIVYHNLGKYDEALKMHSKSLLMLEKLDDDYETRQLMGSTYLHMAATYRELGDLSMAVTYLNKAEKSLKKVADIAGLGSVYNSFGSVYQTMNETEKALKYHFMALETHESIGDLRSVSISQIHIGQIENSRNSFLEGKKWCEKGLAIAQNARGYVEVIDACACLYQSSKGLNDSEKALYYYELSNVYTDSLEREKAADKLHDEEIKRVIDTFNNEDSEVNDKEMSQAEVPKSYTAEVVIGLALLGLAVVIFFLIKRGKKSSRVKEIDFKIAIDKSTFLPQSRTCELATARLNLLKSEALSSLAQQISVDQIDTKSNWILALDGGILVACPLKNDGSMAILVYSIFEKLKKDVQAVKSSHSEIHKTIRDMQILAMPDTELRIIQFSELKD